MTVGSPTASSTKQPLQRQRGRVRPKVQQRWHLAVGETVILLTPPSPSLLKHLLKGEGGAAE